MDDIDKNLVERCINERGASLRFPKPIEHAYELFARRHRSRIIGATIVPTLLIYNAFLILDYLLLPQTFAIALFCHLMIVTPLTLLVGLAVRRQPGLWIRECLSAAVPLSMGAQILFIVQISTNTDVAAHYQYLAVGVLMYANVNQRMDFRFATAMSTLYVIGYLAILEPTDMEFAPKLVGMSLITATAYLSLTANYRMERDTRYGFLRRLHDRLMRDDVERIAERDALTGLANRHQLQRRLYALRENTDEQPMGVLMVDVDHFKSYNDRLGHPAGDTCLKRIAAALIAELRDNRDLGVRYGGEEFLLLLHDSDSQRAQRIAERIRRTIEAAAIPHPQGGIVTVSIGVAAGAPGARSIEPLIQRADAALYEAKQRGRNRACLENGAA